MGWQSYILFFKDDEKKVFINKIIEEHNNATSEMWQNHEVGEELIQITEVKLSDKIPKAYQQYQGAILCGNGGGRSSTFSWFKKHRVCCIAYQGKCEKWFVYDDEVN